MPRPCKNRRIAANPPVTVYKPAGIRARELDWVTLTLDEFEGLRLADAEGLEQAAVAERMGVSRPTVTRILASARAKVATALAAGSALAIEGGPVTFGPCGGRGRRGGWRCRRGGRWANAPDPQADPTETDT